MADLSMPTFLGRVPCAGCTACCRGQIIVLFPDQGDDIASYDHYEVAPGIVAVKEKPNGDCIYLGEDGCTIHDRAPAMCRRFDCRDLVRSFGSRQSRRASIKAGRLSKEIHDAGMARIDTLLEIAHG